MNSNQENRFSGKDQKVLSNIPLSKSPDPKNVWEKICTVLKTHIQPDVFDLWFKPVDPLKLEVNPNKEDERIFTIAAPNKIFADWIREHSEQEIEIILRQALGLKTKLQIIVMEELQEAPKTADSSKGKKTEEFTPKKTDDKIEDIVTEFSNPKYTFETFIEGQTNRFAKAAAEGVAREPGVRFNPLFIYGDVGLGKTHLMHSIIHTIRQNNPKARVLYISSEKFINEFINSLKFENGPNNFRQKYRSLDCLLIDDIQFLMGKGRSEEEFFFTFNTLFDSRKQIVISSDRPPKEMGTLQERLISRFEWGVVADIQAPELETRIAILRKKAEIEKIFVPEDVIVFIASQIRSNIRELEGSLIRTIAYSTLTGAPLTVDSARATLKDLIDHGEMEQPVNIASIQEIVAKNFSLEIRDLKSKRRTDSIAWPRQVAMYLTRELTELSTTDIGQQFGGKDHTTVLHACEKVRLKIAESPFVASLVNRIMQEVKNGK